MRTRLTNANVFFARPMQLTLATQMDMMTVAATVDVDDWLYLTVCSNLLVTCAFTLHGNLLDNHARKILRTNIRNFTGSTYSY